MYSKTLPCRDFIPMFLGCIKIQLLSCALHLLITKVLWNTPTFPPLIFMSIFSNFNRNISWWPVLLFSFFIQKSLHLLFICYLAHISCLKYKLGDMHFFARLTKQSKPKKSAMFFLSHVFPHASLTMSFIVCMHYSSHKCFISSHNNVF